MKHTPDFDVMRDLLDYEILDVDEVPCCRACPRCCG